MMGNKRLVIIEWVDSAQPAPAWRFLDDAPALSVVACLSVGWVVAESEDVIMLAPNIAAIADDEPQGSGFIRIPTRAVIRRAELFEEDDE